VKAKRSLLVGKKFQIYFNNTVFPLKLTEIFSLNVTHFGTVLCLSVKFHLKLINTLTGNRTSVAQVKNLPNKGKDRKEIMRDW
jgi:hypothetical protein